MKLVIQRVTNASVSVDGSTVGSIGKGLLVLVGVEADDTDEMLPKFVNKMLKLRIFEDENATAIWMVFAVHMNTKTFLKIH